MVRGLNKYSIVQHLLLEYMLAVSQRQNSEGQPMELTDQSPQDVATGFDLGRVHQPLLEALVEEGGRLVPMLHTREGVRAALHVLWACSPKLRKTLVKGLKTCISSIGRNEHGHLFLIGLIDVVDDVVLLQKLVVKVSLLVKQSLLHVKLSFQSAERLHKSVGA